MTPRSRRYFAIKKMRHYCRDAFALVAMMIERAKPVPNYTRGMKHPGGPAIIGIADGRVFLPESRIFPMFAPIENMLLAEEYRKALRAGGKRPIIVRRGIWDVNIKNAFTPFEKTDVTKIEDHD